MAVKTKTKYDPLKLTRNKQSCCTFSTLIHVYIVYVDKML